MVQREFGDIVLLIKQSQLIATRAVNAELINLYWQVGECISCQVAGAAWGDKTIDELADFIAKQHPELKGFTRRGLYRMKQFYETCNKCSIVSPVVTQLQNTENQLVKIVSALPTQFRLSDIRMTALSKLSWSHHMAPKAICLNRV